MHIDSPISLAGVMWWHVTCQVTMDTIMWHCVTPLAKYLTTKNHSNIFVWHADLSCIKPTFENKNTSCMVSCSFKTNCKLIMLRNVGKILISWRPWLLGHSFCDQWMRAVCWLTTGTSLVLPHCLQSNISHGKNCNHCNKQSVSAQFLVSSKVIKLEIK